MSHKRRAAANAISTAAALFCVTTSRTKQGNILINSIRVQIGMLRPARKLTSRSSFNLHSWATQSNYIKITVVVQLAADTARENAVNANLVQKMSRVPP